MGCCILGLIAQGCNKQPWLAWVIRVIIGLFLSGELLSLLTTNPEANSSYWILLSLVGFTALLLLKPFRRGLSVILTVPNQIISGRVLLAAMNKLEVLEIVPETATAVVTPETVTLPAGDVPEPEPNVEVVVAASESETTTSEQAAVAEPPAAQAVAPAPVTMVLKKLSVLQSLVAERVFVPGSIPHLHGMWLYVTCLAYLLSHTELTGFTMPAIMIPLPATFDQLFSYNLLGLVFLAFCGVGIFVSRSPKATLERLGLVKPSWRHVFIGIGMIFFTFAYDYFWSMYSHGQAGLGYAEKLSNFNEGTFTAGGGAGPALALATATGFCAGIGEEMLCRGALQPAFGILPAAFLHGVLHGQFAHAPLLILQVFGWSSVMGIVRRYTNTTTTIIAHTGFNFLSTFLFAFNP